MNKALLAKERLLHPLNSITEQRDFFPLSHAGNEFGNVRATSCGFGVWFRLWTRGRAPHSLAPHNVEQPEPGGTRLLSSTMGAEVPADTAVEKCCIKAGNIQCALQMKRFFICVLKEEKYRQAQLITQESSCGYQGSSALIPSDNSKLKQLLCWGFSFAGSYPYNKRNGHCLSCLPFLHLNKFLNCTFLPSETSDLLHFKQKPLLQQYLFLSRFVIRLFLLNCCYSSY